jgi:hypothetical protein
MALFVIGAAIIGGQRAARKVAQLISRQAMTD